MKKMLLIALLFVTTIAVKAQYTSGWDRAMNFGGAGADVEEMRYVNGDLYFFARMMGKYQFAGVTYDAGAIGSYPDQDLIFGKISPNGTQVLLNRFESVTLSAVTGAARIGADGSLYVFRLGMGTAQTLGSLTTPTYGLQLLKIAGSGQFDWVKKINPFSDIEFGTSGVPGPNLYAMQVKDNGDIYAIAKSNTVRGSVYPTRVLKLDNSGNEVWHYEMISPSAGTATAGILVDDMPRQFVDDAGNLTFKVGTTGTISFNGETLPYEEPYVYAGFGNFKNWIISLNPNGVKKWNTSAYVSPTFYGVNPVSGEIYINYSYTRQTPAAPASIAPFSSLPNLAPPPVLDYMPEVFAWNGIITLNPSGGIVKSKINYINATAYPTQMQIADNGRILLFSATANGNVFKAGDNFISFNGSGYAAMEIDANFNPLKVFKLPAGSVMALANNKFAFGGSFKNQTTIGNSTLTPNFIDTDFNTRFPSWASIKTDVLIAEGNLDNVSLSPETTTWTGNTSTDWNNAGNWTNGVPTDVMRAAFSGNTANMPANVPASSKAGQIYIPANAEVTLPPGYGVLTVTDKIINNGKINVENASFLFNFFGASEVKGSGEFNFKGAASVFSFTGNIANTVSFDNTLSMSGVTVNSLKFIGANAKLTGDITVSNPDVNAISGLSSTNYINGKLTRAVNSSGTYAFPLANGSNSNLKQAMVNYIPDNLSGTSFVSAKYSVAAPGGAAPNITIDGSLVSTILNTGFVTITPDIQPTAGTYSINASLPSLASAITDPSKYVLIKRNNSTSPWIFQGNRTVATSITNAGSNKIVNISLSGVNSFSDFAIGVGDNAITLPVELDKFMATAQNNAVLLSWETLSETSNDKFVIERSTDGQQFLPIGEIDGKGDSKQIEVYRFEDDQPLNGYNYYRLNQIDLDGKSNYSDIKAVNFSITSTAINVFPNPFINSLSFTGIKVEPAKAVLYNSSGKEVYNGLLLNNSLAVPSYLPAGIYVVKVTAEGKTIAVRQLVK